MSTEPGADERRMAHLLRQRIDGPTAHQTTPQRLVPAPTAYAPDAPAAPARDWWDGPHDQAPAVPVRGGGRLPDWRKPKRTLNTLDEPEHEPETAEAPEPDTAEDDGQEHTATAEQPDPEAVPAVPPGWWQPQPGYYPGLPTTLPVPQAPPVALSPRTRSLLYNAGAAGAGWSLGLYGQFARAVASCGTETSIGGALTLGIGGCFVIAHVWDRRTRHWWTGLAWAARIPLATAVTALALYAPASQI
jgi:hypothetical protein